MSPVSIFGRLNFKIKNLPFIKPFVERNRWLVRLYFDHRYKKNDPYMYSSSAYERKKAEDTIGFINDTHYERVLDIGCGEGYLSERLCPISGEILAIDISKMAIERARRRAKHKNINFSAADILALELRQRFNLIVCSEVLVYLNPRQIQEVAVRLVNWLEPEGRLLLVNVFAKGEAEGGLELKGIGAGTIHPLFLKIKSLKSVRAKVEPQYAMLLLQKI